MAGYYVSILNINLVEASTRDRFVRAIEIAQQLHKKKMRRVFPHTASFFDNCQKGKYSLIYTLMGTECFLFAYNNFLAERTVLRGEHDKNTLRAKIKILW